MNLPINVPSEGIIFCAVDKNIDGYKVEGALHFFSDETDLRKWKLGKNNVVYLDDVADKHCKKCNGTGKLGERLRRISTSEEGISEILVSNINNDKLSDEDIGIDLVRLFGLPAGLGRPMGILMKLARKELSDDNVKKVSDKYARIIRKDFQFRQIVWCKCFIKNLTKQVEETVRNLKFSIN